MELSVGASTLEPPSGILRAMTGATHTFVGRSREIEALRHALLEGAQGRGSLWLVTGEPGIGKSRLLEEVARVAADRDIQVFWGRCWEAGGAPAYWPWIQVLRALVERAVPMPGALSGAAWARDLAELMPEIQPPDGTAPSHVALQPDQARFRLMDAVTRTLQAASQSGPLLILLEDLHAADSSSLLLLSFVARQLTAAPIVVVGTLREGDVPRGEVAVIFERLLRDGHPLSLGRFDRAQVETFLSRMHQDFDSALVDSVYTATEGNPLFVGELARYLTRSGVRPESVGLRLPPGIRGTIQARLSLLTESTLFVLQLASVIGRECRRTTLLALGREQGLDVDAACDEASAAEVMVEAAPGVLRFSHVLLQQVIYTDIAAPRRCLLHASTATVLMDSSSSAAERAHHWLAAGDDHLGRAAEAAIEAACEADARHALSDVAHWYGRALEAKARASASNAERCEIMLALGHAQIAAHELTAGRASCQQAAQMARELGDGERLARAALAYGAVYTIGEVHKPLVALLHEALAALPPDDAAIRARAMARLAAALQPAADPLPPMQLARDAIAMARRVGDASTLLSTIVAGCSAIMDLGDPTECRELELEQIAIARQLGDVTEEFRGNLRLVFTAYQLGDLATARAAIEACVQAAALLDQPHFGWRVQALLAMQALAEGAFGAAEMHMDEARRMGERAGDPNASRTLANQRLTLLRLRGRMPEMRKAIEELEASIPVVPETRVMVDAYVGGQLVWIGDREGALARLRRIGEMTGVLAKDATLFESAADLAALSGNEDLISHLLTTSVARTERWSTGGVFGFTWDQPVARSLGRLALARGQLDEALAYQDRAVSLVRPTGLRGLLTWALHEARELAQQVGDDDEARRYGAEADALAAELGIALAPSILIGAPPATIAASSAREPTSLVPSVPALAMTREGEVWCVRCGDRVVRIKDGRGVQMLARLLENADHELHVLDLASSGGAIDGGDSGVLLDETARRQYKARIQSLRVDVEEAQQFGDPVRAERAQRELDVIAAEVARGMGLGGRERRAGAAVERARVNVQRRLRDAIAKLSEHDGDLGRHLTWAVKTGTYCSYRPRG